MAPWGFAFAGRRPNGLPLQGVQAAPDYHGFARGGLAGVQRFSCLVFAMVSLWFRYGLRLFCPTAPRGR